ncbi:MAG TPA: restriction endonuclease [Acetobacteraceae bacterium]|nr:restriction endonuclease [Acetobacteraceae bacterium]
MTQAAFVLRIGPKGIEQVSEVVSTNQIFIGWAEAEGLLDLALPWERFREIIRQRYYQDEQSLRRAGAAAGHMWRFIREMKPEDLVVVPHGTEFFVAKITGLAIYDASKVADGSAYRRPVEWLNDRSGVPRRLARSALLSRMKTQGVSAYATGLLPEIHECLELAAQGRTPTFAADLQARLVRETLDEMRSGRMDDFGFERLIADALRNLGAEDVQIVSRNKDEGADLVATFRVAGTFQQRVAVQAKHWKPDPPVGQAVVQQLIDGIEAEGASLGMIVTTGAIAEDAVQAAERYYESKGIRIELVDGEQFAKLIVEYGVR